MDADTLKRGLATFGWNLYKSVSEKDGNVFISPHSVCSALMLACLGAKGETEKQILSVIGVKQEDGSNTHELYKSFNDSLAEPTSNETATELSVANKLYVKKSMQISEMYLKKSSGLYGNTTEKVDFSQNPDEVRNAINQWVEQQTKHKIKDLLPEGSVTGLTNLVIVNAIYFKGTWEKPFETKHTEKADFHISASETVRVDMMHAELKLPVVIDDELKCSAIAMPYDSSGISMILILPDKESGLDELEQKLSATRVNALRNDVLAGLKGNVKLGLPKFSMTETIDLSTILSKLGIVDLFDPSKADLSGLTDESNIAINDVIHKAHIEVNEEGTEAAAATAMISRMMLMPLQNYTFVCDKPFLFILTDSNTGALLFIGRYSRPT